LLDSENPLVKLAELVLSFVPNSASVERLFSSMGDTKSKKRTRLTVQKNRDISFLKMELRRQHAIDGTAQRRLKRRFGNPETVADRDPTGSRMEDQELIMNADADALLTDSNSDDADGDRENLPPSSFSAVAQQAVRDVDDDDNDDYISGLGEVVEVEEDISGPEGLGTAGSRQRRVSCSYSNVHYTNPCLWLPRSAAFSVRRGYFAFRTCSIGLLKLDGTNFGSRV
jgi:hypothetical protein